MHVSIPMKIRLLFLFVLVCAYGYAQKTVSFTIDDVPNTRLFQQHRYQSRLLKSIDSLQIPVAVFINEKLLHETDSLTRNIRLLQEWINDPLVTVGNHGYSHAFYSEAGIENYKAEILKGEAISAELARKAGKKEIYFRFPYNDLGKDATQHTEAEVYLQSIQYIVTPFTVHSDDWLVTQLYEYYVGRQDYKNAQRIGQQFVAKTLEQFDYTESLTSTPLKREVKQIYLLHDNLLNADYLDELVDALRKKGYRFCTLDEAMTDPVYKQKDHYTDKHGISWVYRWIENPKTRLDLMRKSPNQDAFEAELKSLKK